MEQKTGVSIVKWLVIGFLGGLALIFTFVIVLVLMFSPVIRIDEPKGKVVVLGGLIEVTGKMKDQMKEAGPVKTAKAFEMDLQEKGVSNLVVNFNMGDMTIKTSPSTLLKLDCENPVIFDEKIEKDRFVLELSQNENLKCELFVPEKMGTSIKGGNGKVSILAPRFDLQVKMVNAKMSFSGAEGIDYKFNNSVAYGTMDNFNSSDKKEAYKISLSLVNGTLNKGN